MKALLVIDMQNICVGENHAKYFKYENETLIKAVNTIINNNQNHLVVYIRNIMKRNLINKLAPFQAYEGTAEVELVKTLEIITDYIFDKYEGNAFTNEKLIRFLKEHDVDEIEVIGVDGGGCVALTALGAIKSGYKVTVNTNGIGTMMDKNRKKYFQQLLELGAIFI